MKTEKARDIIIAALKEKSTITSQEINYASKGTIAFVQIYGILKSLINNGSVQMNESDGKKVYTLIDESKLTDEPKLVVKTKPEKIKPVEKIEDDEKEEKQKVKTGRDLTTYKFNGIDYNKGRLAHAIISQYAKEKKPTLKAALEMFPDEIVRPYGVIRPIKEAKVLNKRFFARPEEEIKLRDAVIAVSNQFTPERIAKVIAIGKKLGYKIK